MDIIQHIYNCYNVGKLSCNKRGGSTVGTRNVNGGVTKDINCATTNATAELLNSGEFSENVWKNDEKGINNGYPILNWQLNN